MVQGETGVTASFGLLHVHNMVRSNIATGATARKICSPLQELPIGPLHDMKGHLA